MAGWKVVAIAGSAAAVLTITALVPPSGNRSIRSFDADRIANLEVGMWQAYYAKERLKLFGLLVLTLREQYHYSWATAVGAAFHLARAAATFGDASGNYEVVLPDLTAAYQTVKAQSRATFDPRDVARAELSWWVARRVPGQNSSQQIGRLIAEEYAALYAAPVGDVARAGLLRAQAAALRDAQAANPDWDTIRQMLIDSYRDLRSELSPPRVAAK
jgi:hypothetical protein